LITPSAIHIKTNDEKPAQIRFHAKRPYNTITKMNDNINMESTIAGTMDARSSINQFNSATLLCLSLVRTWISNVFSERSCEK
jgi:hypothetical protein